MPYTDPTFEQRRAQLLKGSPQATPTSGGFSSGGGSGGFLDQSFEVRRKQIYSTPAKPIAPVSVTPTPNPNLQPEESTSSAVTTIQITPTPPPSNTPGPPTPSPTAQSLPTNINP